MLIAKFLVPFVAALAVVPSLVAQTSASDDFNRPNSTNMGPDWVEVYGNTAISNNQGVGASGAFSKGWMHHSSFQGNYADSVQTIDFQAVGVLSNVVLLAGLDPNTWGCVSLKLQDNNGNGLMDRVFFESAFNAGNWGTVGSPVKYDLLTETASGRLTLRFTDNGDTAVCEIENAASGQTEMTTASGILTFPFPLTGSDFGIGHSGDPLFDNWSVSVDTTQYGAGCAGSGGFVPSFTALNPAVAGQGLGLQIADGIGGGSAILMMGIGQASLPIGPVGCTLLVSPTPILVQTPAIPMGGVGPGNGSVQIAGLLPLSMSGITFNIQAFVIDAGAPLGFAASNGLEFLVQ